MLFVSSVHGNGYLSAVWLTNDEAVWAGSEVNRGGGAKAEKKEEESFSVTERSTPELCLVKGPWALSISFSQEDMDILFVTEQQRSTTQIHLHDNGTNHTITIRSCTT